MRTLVPTAGILLVTAGCQGERAEDDSNLVREIKVEDVAPHASGICLAEIIQLAERDERPPDGNLFLGSVSKGVLDVVS